MRPSCSGYRSSFRQLLLWIAERPEVRRSGWEALLVPRPDEGTLGAAFENLRSAIGAAIGDLAVVPVHGAPEQELRRPRMSGAFRPSFARSSAGERAGAPTCSLCATSWTRRSWETPPLSSFCGSATVPRSFPPSTRGRRHSPAGGAESQRTNAMKLCSRCGTRWPLRRGKSLRSFPPRKDLGWGGADPLAEREATVAGGEVRRRSSRTR